MVPKSQELLDRYKQMVKNTILFKKIDKILCRN